jgi:hypothetical protein
MMKSKTMYQRHRDVLSVMIVTLVLVLSVVLGSRSLAIAQNQCDDLVLLDGEACVGFDLCIEFLGGAKRVDREFEDKDGNVVRMISAGRGDTLLFENLSTGNTLSLASKGAVEKITYHPDESETHVVTGHNVIILFSTDVGGPSATLYTGRVVFTVDTDGVWDVIEEEVSGKETDICAVLSE